MDLWYLAFVDPDRPPDQQFLGAAIVRCISGDMKYSMGNAVKKSHLLHINPGGEVHGTVMDDRFYELLPKEFIEQLLTPNDIIHLEQALRELKK